MKIAFFLQGLSSNDYTPHVSPVMKNLFDRLREKGADVSLLVPEETPQDLSEISPSHDVYVLKSKTPLTMSLAGALTAEGVRVINPFRATLLARDKIASTAVLSSCGIPVPPSWTTGTPAFLTQLVNETSVWIKPPDGSRGRGICRINKTSDINSLTPPPIPPTPIDAYGLPLSLFVQQEVPSSGRDLKVYVIGDKTWAITRPWPAVTMEDKVGQPAQLSNEIQATALACGKALGLEIYGVDFIVMEDSFFVIDVNAFPGFKGIHQAPSHLAEYIFNCGKDIYQNV